MYISSDGTKKNIKEMNTEYIINALAKNYREIFTTQNMEEFEKFSNNIQELVDEMTLRINNFIDTNGKEWE